MTPERKTARISARLPAALVVRADFVARNDVSVPGSRSAVLQAALEAWLPGQEKKLEDLLGPSPKKAR